ncbi:MAG: hypothetical protein ACTSWY_05910 [Promethearchaeota archaeon]
MLLIDENSPPCLIFQGLGDGLIPPIVSQSMKDLYDLYDNKNTGNCTVLYMPTAVHMSDIYFSGYFNIIFLYYIERFLYIFR